MSSGSASRASRQDIQLVQNLIEQCLRLYMNQKEVVETLLAQAKIEPDFTELVWQKLEEENRDFFKAYYLRLLVKDQIIEFNNLLDQQVQLIHQIHPTNITSIPAPNGSHISPLHQNSACYPSERAGPGLKPENTNHQVTSVLPNTFTNGGSSLHTSLQSAVVSRIDAPPNMFSTQSSNVGLIQRMNGATIKQEVGYSESSSYVLCADGNVLEARPSLADAPVASFSSVESSSQQLNEPLMDADTTSYGVIGQISRNFSLSDLTADFSQSSDILESYSRSPFLATDTENFLDSRERGEHQDST